MRSTRRRFVTTLAGAAPIAHELHSWAGGRSQLNCVPSEFNSERLHAQDYNSCANASTGVQFTQTENTIDCAMDSKPFFVYQYNTKIPEVRRRRTRSRIRSSPETR